MLVIEFPAKFKKKVCHQKCINYNYTAFLVDKVLYFFMYLECRSFIFKYSFVPFIYICNGRRFREARITIAFFNRMLRAVFEGDESWERKKKRKVLTAANMRVVTAKKNGKKDYSCSFFFFNVSKKRKWCVGESSANFQSLVIWRRL